MKFKTRLAVTAVLTIISSAAAYADTITITLFPPPNPIVNNVAGGSLIYDATVSAPSTNGSPVFLNGDSFNVTAPVTLDDSDFFIEFPLSLAPGTHFTGDLFVLTLPPNTPIGNYLGTFTLLGGASGNASNTLGTVNFSAASTAPEPSSIAQALTGMAGLAMILIRTRWKAGLRGGAR